MNLFDLTGKVAVITGSTKGIGKAIAEQLAQHGANVVISSRKKEVCDEVTAAINEMTKDGAGSAFAVPANISRKEDLQNLVDKSREHYGKIDILVCNAAANPYYGPMLGINDEQFDKVMDNNIKSNHWLCSMVIPEMQARKDGSITIISSIAGLVGHTTLGAYGLSKAADFALARNIAAEFGPDNVRANAIAPGLIKTDFARALWDNPEYLEAATANCPLRRIGTPEEIAGGVVFLASAAGNFVTGQTLTMDGGRTISNE